MFRKGLYWSFPKLLVKMFVTMAFKTVMYKNGQPFVKKKNIVILSEDVVCNFFYLYDSVDAVY